MRRLALAGMALISVASYYLAAPAGDNADEACFRSKTNVERTSRNIPALKNNEDLNIIASRHSEEMAARGTIYHNDNLANEPGVKPFTAAGENVGMGSGCEIIHQAFMDSPGHKENILDREYTEVGFGVEERDDTIYVTEIFRNPGKAAATPPKPKPKCTCPG